MKRLILSGLSVLLVFSASAPAFASGKVNKSNTEACQSIPLPSPTGGGTTQRLEAIRTCDMEVMLEQQQAMMSQMNAMTSQMNAMTAQMKAMMAH